LRQRMNSVIKIAMFRLKFDQMVGQVFLFVHDFRLVAKKRVVVSEK
jgi:hypothetical protein